VYTGKTIKYSLYYNDSFVLKGLPFIFRTVTKSNVEVHDDIVVSSEVNDDEDYTDNKEGMITIMTF